MFGELDKSAVLDNWLEIISDYKNRNLSVSGENLFTCAALAETFANILGWGPSNYLAGLWGTDIQAQLP